jgi:predicted tellurium resistance membrane protein TerC
MEWISDPNIWTALITLIVLEIVLGVDNVIFISILAAKLPEADQARARQTGLILAAVMRIGFLFSISLILQLKQPLFTVLGQALSGKDLILLAGGLFLLYKATKEIHDKLEGEEGHGSSRVAPTFAAVIGQVLLLDLVFSIDSVITAVGMTEYVPVMIAAVVASVGVMLLASGSIFGFVNRHPSVKILALSFLMLIGVSLVAEAFDAKIPKGYIYFSMAFSVIVEILNIRSSSRKSKPVELHQAYVEEAKQPLAPVAPK